MNTRKITVAAVFVIAAMGLGAGTSYADPAATEAADIGYETKLVDNNKTVLTTIDAGMFEFSSDGRTVDLKDDAGRVVVNMPLSFTAGPLEFPLIHTLTNAGRTLSLTPDADLTKARPAGIKPVASLLENQRAQNAFATQFGLATAVGGFVGTAAGAVIGGILGAAVAAATCVAALACIVTALPLIATGAGVGAVLGTIAVGGPALAIAGTDLIGTLTAPEGSTKWNYVEPK